MGLLGQGAMGAVYHARELASGTEVALKLILEEARDPLLRERFIREGKATAALRHPGIIWIHDAGEQDGRLYLAYELIRDCRTLNEVYPQLTRDERLGLLVEAGRALGHAHERGVVHRDVKPENLLVDAGGRLRVADFGVASMETARRLTLTGELVGSPAYMAPEQIDGDRSRYGPPLDVWALGVLLYLMLVEEKPFAGHNLLALSQVIMDSEPKAPRAHDRSISPQVEAVCLKALRKEPYARYRDGSAFAKALEGALAAEAEAAQAPEGPPAWLAVASVLLVLVLAGVAVALWWPSGEEPARVAASPTPAVTRETPPPSPPPTPPPLRATPTPTPTPTPGPRALERTRWSLSDFEMLEGGVGPWLLAQRPGQAGRQTSTLIRPEDGSLLELPDALRPGVVVWDPAGVRALYLTRARRLVAARQGLEPRELLALPETSASLGLFAGRLAVGTTDGRLLGYDAGAPAAALWELELPGRLDVPPLPLDLAGDGVSDHLLVCGSDPVATLVDAAGRRVGEQALPGGVLRPPAALARRAVGGSLPLVIGCREGPLVRLRASAVGLLPEAEFDLGAILTTSPVPVLNEAGTAQQLLVGTTWGLVALRPDLSGPEWVGGGLPLSSPVMGELALVDLDGDGTREVACASAVGNTGWITVYSLAGELVGRLQVGGARLRLLGGEQEFVVGGVGEPSAWEGGALSPPRPPVDEDDALRQLLVGAWERTRTVARVLGTPRAQVYEAIAASYQDERQLIQELAGRGGLPPVEALVGESMRIFVNTSVTMQARLALPLGARPPRADPQGGTVPTRPWRKAKLGVKFPGLENGRARKPPKAAGMSLRIAGVDPRLWFHRGGWLEASFIIDEPGPYRLLISHNPAGGMPDEVRHAQVSISVDGKLITRRRVAWWGGREDAVELGTLEAGPHALSLRLSERSLTVYMLHWFELEPSGVR